MTAYTYSRVAALNFNTTPPTVARSATGSVYATADTTFTTPLTITMVVGGSTTTTVSSDSNGFFPDFTVADRVSVVWKQAASSFTTVLTTTDPVPGPTGATGAAGATGAKGDRGDLATWQTATFYPLNQAIINPSGDIVKVITAHTSGGSYDATKFDYANNTVVDAQTAAKINDGASATRAALNATYGPSAAGMTSAFGPTAAPMQAAFSPFDPPLANEAALRPWLASLANRDAQSARLLILSHSFGEGIRPAGTTSASGYPYRLKDQLAGRYPVKFGRDGGYVPAHDYYASHYTTVSGTAPTNGTNYGFGDRTVAIPNATVISVPFTGTGLTLRFPKLTNYAFTISIDGGSAVAVDQSTGAAGDGNYYTTGTFSPGAHTATITATGSSGAQINGWHVYDGNEAGGTLVTNASHTGYDTAMFVTNSLPNLIAAIPKALSPTGVVIMLTANDYRNSIASATTRTNLNTIISQIKSVLPTDYPPGVLIAIEHERKDTGWTPAEPWANYVTAAKNAAADSGAAYIDFTARIPHYDTGNSNGMISTDKCHPTDKGYAFYADAILEFMTRGHGAGKPITSVPETPWVIQVDPKAGPASNIVGAWALSVNANYIGNGVRYNSSNAQNDETAYDLVLAPGTWAFDFTYAKNTNGAIATVYLQNEDGSYTSIGTVDTYAASAAYNQVTSITGVTVSGSSSIRRRLRLVMATRNASNTTGWYLNLQNIQARRSA